MREKLEDILAPEVLMKLGNYPLMARRAVEGYMSGLHKSVSKGSGGEFLQYRSYTVGDDFRGVDWKLYARSGRLFQKVRNEETEFRCSILVDGSASMGYKGSRAPCSKYGYAAMLASCFAYLSQRQGDKPGLCVYSGDVVHATPVGQRTPELPLLLNILEDVEPAGKADYERALLQAEKFLGGKKGMFILISDLWGVDGQLEKILRRMNFAGRDCIVCQILDYDELELPFQDVKCFVDSETGDSISTSPQAIRQDYQERMGVYLEQLRRTCLANQSDYLLCRTDAAIGESLRVFLGRRGGTY